MKITIKFEDEKNKSKYLGLLNEIASKNDIEIELGKENKHYFENKTRFLKSDNIYLTKFTEKHLKSTKYEKWMNDLNITSNLGMLDYITPVYNNQLENYFKNTINNDNIIFFAIHEKENDEFIGTTKLGPINWLVRTVETGWLIGDETKRGKGYGTEVLELVIEYCFNVLNINKITAGTFNSNKAARSILEKFNFNQEGILKDAGYKNGELINVIRFCLFKDDWMEKHEKV